LIIRIVLIAFQIVVARPALDNEIRGIDVRDARDPRFRGRPPSFGGATDDTAQIDFTVFDAHVNEVVVH